MLNAAVLSPRCGFVPSWDLVPAALGQRLRPACKKLRGWSWFLPEEVPGGGKLASTACRVQTSSRGATLQLGWGDFKHAHPIPRTSPDARSIKVLFSPCCCCVCIGYFSWQLPSLKAGFGIQLKIVPPGAVQTAKQQELVLNGFVLELGSQHKTKFAS